MAKACAYLCRYCRFIEGFREFGENIRSKRRTQIASIFAAAVHS